MDLEKFVARSFMEVVVCLDSQHVQFTPMMTNVEKVHSRCPQKLQKLQITITQYHYNYSDVSLHDQCVPNTHILDTILLIAVSSLALFIVNGKHYRTQACL